MSSRHLVDPETLLLLEGVPQVDLSAETLAQTRAFDATLRETGDAEPLQDGMKEQWLMAPGDRDAAPIPVLVIGPDNPRGAAPAILYIHGGGYICGSPSRSRPSLMRLVGLTGAVVLAPRYRLAPETRFPGAVEDCYATLIWMHRNADALGIDPHRTAIMGVSAGGGLAACLSLLARDRGEVQIVLQALTFPMLDDRTGSLIDPGPMAGEFMWTAASNRFGWECLLGRAPGDPDVSPYASAARARSLKGLPATWIGVGALDLFLAENLEFGLRLARDGVPIELKVYPGAVHAFMLADSSRLARTYNRDVGEAFNTAFLRKQ